MKKYVPLILVECYLIATLLLFYFGPVNFNVHNEVIFIILMFLYHVSFIASYCIGVITYKDTNRLIDNSFTSRFYYISFFFAFIGALGTYNNLMLSTSIIPYSFFDDLIRGISEPGLVYTERMMGIESGATSDSRLFNITSMFFAFFKLLFIFQFVYFWQFLSGTKKVVAIMYSLFFVSAGISSGTNSVIFIFFIFLIFSLLITLYIRQYRYLKRIFIFSGILVLLPILSFGYIMSQRGGGFEYFASTSPLGDISVTIKSINPEDSTVLDFLSYSFVWLNYYVVQGYYGFSLILDLDHNWTFGFGNSAFLQRQLSVLTGIDVSKLTYQHRISQFWDESAQWHSFYSQFANDFGLIGLTILMCFLGYYFARIWSSVIFNKSVYGAALLPIFIIMFIFFPANNQIFGYIDTFSYFIFVSIFWFFERRNVAHVCR